MENISPTYMRKEITRHSVIHAERESTNVVAGAVFVISFILWIAVAVYAMIVRKDKEIKKEILDFSEFDQTRILTLSGFVLLSIILTLIIWIMLTRIPSITKITLVTFWIPVPFSILLAYYSLSLFSVTQAIGSILSCILIINLLSTEWFHMPEKVLKEACKMIFLVPSTLLFALFCTLVTGFLIALLIIVAVNLLLSRMDVMETICMIVNLIFGLWAVVTFSVLALMTLNGTYAEYYWAQKKHSVSLGTVLRLFGINLRYHIGTAAMHFPIPGFLQALVYVLKVAIRALKQQGASASLKLFVLYNIFDMIVLRITLLGTAAMCGITGQNFKESMTGAMTLFLNNPRRFLVVIKVMELMSTLAAGIVVFFTSFATSFYLASNSQISSLEEFIDLRSWEMKFLIMVLVGGLVFVAVFLECLSAASYSIVLSVQQEVNDLGDTLPSHSYAMSRDLYSALSRSGPPRC